VNIAALRDFKAQHGHCNVPSKYPENMALSNWVSNVKNGVISLTEDRGKNLAEELGFDFSVDRKKDGRHSQERWKVNIAALRDFKAQHGHCNVPSKYPENMALSNWVRNVKTGVISLTVEDREANLADLGFDFSGDRSKNGRNGTGQTGKKEKSHERIKEKSDERWRKMNKAAISDFKAQYEHCNVGSSPQRKMGEHVHAPQDFQSLDNGQFDDSLDTDDSEVGFVSSGVSHGENMAPKVDRKKCMEEAFTKTDQPRREAPSQVRTVDLFDVVPISKPKICSTTVVFHSMIRRMSHSHLLSAKNGVRIWHSWKMMKWTCWKSCVSPLGCSIIKARFDNGISGWGYEASSYIIFGVELVSYCILLLVYALVGSVKIVIGLSCRSSTTRIE
jgi:hypothetical protein